ncbi:hypothetical protein DYU11_21090 [Fibrisoma montanum]|uniref:Peptidase S49 domain-containing protein n=1 Tax=Fibrisoma montanum TaxID=2305895 RepID=A0A418M4F5_9BACT|nr:S49 family peptidase [Fibrisoma montanum]RIV20543.1 hypothetical protein DYU11_21090 [Fibrisoma montanum]
MNRHFRQLSALLRHDWAIDESFAASQLPLINAYLDGTFAGSMLVGDDEQRPIGYALTPKTKISSSGRTRISAGDLIRYQKAAAESGRASASHSAGLVFDDPDIPANSVAIIDVRGAIMKEGFCGSYGTEDYTRELQAVYANDSLLGAVILVDSGGGQLSGTPTFYDTVRNPVKPTVVLVNDGMMASAAYWLACGADYILASQPTDQIGSIGVFCRLRDYSEGLKKNGIKEITVYAPRSKDKNKPYRDALKGDTKLLEQELNESVAHFEAAVRQGRGDKIQATEEDEPFTGKLYSAEDALEMGLIDGFGNLNTAIDKVIELAEAQSNPAGQKNTKASSTTPDSSPALADTDPTEPAPDTAPASAEGAEPTPTNQTQDDMFGNKHKNLTALAGLEASAITDEQLNAANTELDGLNIKGVRVISTTYLQEAEQSVANLATAQAQITTLTEERDRFKEQAEKFGNQPGVVPTKVQKTEEALSDDQVIYISDTDAELAREKAKLKGK